MRLCGIKTLTPGSVQYIAGSSPAGAKRGDDRGHPQMPKGGAKTGYGDKSGETDTRRDGGIGNPPDCKFEVM